jgi:hypothetical protein
VYAVAAAAQHQASCCFGSYAIVSLSDDVRLCAHRACAHPLYRGSGSGVRQISSDRLDAVSRDPYGGWPHLVRLDVQTDLLDLLGGAS